MSVPWRRTAVAAVVAAAVLAGCAAPGPEAPSSAPRPPAPAPSTPAGTPDLGAPEEIATNLAVPWGLAFLPGGDALVSERETGRVLRLTPGRPPEPVREFPDAVVQTEGGLLGLAASPRIGQDDLVYAYYTTAVDARIVRFRARGTDPPEVVLGGIPRGPGHSGGRLAFGPDGMLYATVGDGTMSDRAQDPAGPNGKILRITPEGDPAPGNPFPGSPVYSLGHRNPQGIAWDAAGRMWAAEFGQDEVDEINIIEPGRNYGWPVVEGVGDTASGRFTNPLRTWTVAEASPSGIAIAGGTLYMAALQGERLWTVPLDGDRAGEPASQLSGRYGRLRTAQVAPDGALWLTTSNTQRSGDARGGDDRVLRFPSR
ncbi:PQQ-dependent sugar dehydrogenase [Actinomycetospora aeridis]|uniref:PQQ-dependent sugar dehydrogenase n=1 Tax=Actinomycetospora aeridis TaxID=3129231 RepID=A0ABU8NDN8_9PSEU